MRRAALLTFLTVAIAGCGSTPAAVQQQPGGWSAAAASPLSARHSIPAVTVDDEVLFLGGDTSPLCPPAASCAGQPEPQRDGAAYDPAKDTWRRLAPAPVQLSPGPTAVVGSTVYLLAEATFAGYDVGTDTWTTLPAPPESDGLLAAAGTGVLRYAPTQEGGRITADHLYDGAWVGRQLVVMGGGGTDGVARELTADAYVWTAPS